MTNIKRSSKTGAKSGTETLKHHLSQGEQRLKAKGVNAAAAYFRSVVKKGKTQLSLEDLLERLARSIQLRDPKRALTTIEKLLEINEQRPSAWTLATSLYDRLGERKKAKEAGLRVVNDEQADPQDVLQAANLLVRLGADAIAVASAEQAFAKLGRPLGWVPSIQYIAQRTAAWELSESLITQIEQAYRDGDEAKLNETPRTHILWCTDEARNIEVVRNWSEKKIAIPSKVLAPPKVEALDGRKIRVGYLSSDYREHPTSRLINGLLRHHDRSKFEIYLYCSGWDDGSEMRKQIESHADHVFSVASLSDRDSAELIRSHNIDVLVELNGPTRANRMSVLALRPAPVQIDYLGWPGSVGGRVVDYIVGDYYTVPAGAEKLYPEKILRLRDTYQVNDYAAAELPAPPARAKYRLPEGVPVIGMLNAINKVDRQVWSVWMRILKEVPEAVLWILDPGPVARENLSRYTKEFGVKAKRIYAAPLVSQAEHLARLQLCDIMVDPWPYGGHTSTSDALFSGVPVVSLEGTNFPSRVSGGLLRAAGLGQLVRPDVDDYVAVAVELLKNPGKIKKIKRHLVENRQRLGVFNARARAREMEAGYRIALDLFARNKPAAHISIGKPPTDITPLKENSAAAKTNQMIRKNSVAKPPVVLVCGPWSSGTSAVTGALANAGLPAPGPYLKVNDPRTSQTFEMKAFRELMLEIASEETLKRTKTESQTLSLLSDFREQLMMQVSENSGEPVKTPLLLKHALASLILPEMSELFDLRLIVVLRPYEAIEATRLRRRWHSSFGKEGAKAIYGAIMDFMADSSVPFTFVRYSDFLEKPDTEIARLSSFCGLKLDKVNLASAVKFVRK